MNYIKDGEKESFPVFSAILADREKGVKVKDGLKIG